MQKRVTTKKLFPNLHHHVKENGEGCHSHSRESGFWGYPPLGSVYIAGRKLSTRAKAVLWGIPPMVLRNRWGGAVQNLSALPHARMQFSGVSPRGNREPGRRGRRENDAPVTAGVERGGQRRRGCLRPGWCRPTSRPVCTVSAPRGGAFTCRPCPCPSQNVGAL